MNVPSLGAERAWRWSSLPSSPTVANQGRWWRAFSKFKVPDFFATLGVDPASTPTKIIEAMEEGLDELKNGEECCSLSTGKPSIVLTQDLIEVCARCDVFSFLIR